MNVNPTFFVIMVELLAVESLALIVITVLFIRRKIQYKHMIEHIVEAADASETARLEVLEKTLKDVFNEEGEDASRKARELARAESRFCKRLISAFVNRKHGILGRLDKMTDELLYPYRTLISETAEEKVRTKTELSKRVKSLKHTVESLREEKENITRKLAETEKELESITAEYVSAFKKEEQLKREQAAAMETSAEKDSETVAEAATDEPAEGGPSAAPTGETAEKEESAIAITDGSGNQDDADDEDAGLLKLEDLEEDSTAISGEAADEDEPALATGDDGQESASEEITVTAESPADIPDENQAGQEENTEAPVAADDDTAAAGDSGTSPEDDAILEDVDIAAAPLMEEVAKENAARSRSAAAS